MESRKTQEPESFPLSGFCNVRLYHSAKKSRQRSLTEDCLTGVFQKVMHTGAAVKEQICAVAFCR